MKPALVRTPRRAESGVSDEFIIRSFAKLDTTAFGVAFATLLGSAVFLATLILVLKGGARVGPHLTLLSQYFIGYSVTLRGSLIGLLYGGACGFALGWLTAFLRNLFVTLYLYTIKLKASLSSIDSFLDHL